RALHYLPTRRSSDLLEALLPRVDILSLHCPLTDSTRKMIGRNQLALMKPGSLLINTGRGGLVDEQALVDSLRSGHLGGAGFDVLDRKSTRLNSSHVK